MRFPAASLTVSTIVSVARAADLSALLAAAGEGRHIASMVPGTEDLAFRTGLASMSAARGRCCKLVLDVSAIPGRRDAQIGSAANAAKQTAPVECRSARVTS